MAQLKARGRWDNTVLAITSDHGEEFWDHGGYEHGHTLMGELTRVPLIIAGAGKPRGRVDAIVEHVDLVAGLVGLADGQRTAGATGTDLWTIMDGTATDHVNTALSENTMYGPGKVSIVDETARLEFVFETRSGSIWRVDADGVERKRVSAADRQATGKAPESSGEGQARRPHADRGCRRGLHQDNEDVQSAAVAGLHRWSRAGQSGSIRVLSLSGTGDDTLTGSPEMGWRM